MKQSRELENDPDHPVLERSWEFEIVGLRLEKKPLDGTEPFPDVTLQRADERHVLRFWSPTDIEIERGGPIMTHGLVIRDIRARGLEGIGVCVDDFEATPGSVRFLARSVEEILNTATEPPP